MANDNNIKNFTALDIEKYHKGQLSSKEMHDLEKAALDDPFLADALEGYATPEINVTSDIAELKKRLSEKTEQAKVIPLHGGAGASFPWLRAAVLIVLIAGAGLLAYQFLFSSKSNDIAQANPKEIQKEKSEDSINRLIKQTPNDTSSENSFKSGTLNSDSKESLTINKDQKQVADEATSDYDYRKDTARVSSGIAANKQPTMAVPVIKAVENNEYKKADDVAKQRQDATAGKSDAAVKAETKDKELVLNNLNLNKPVFKNTNGAIVEQEKTKEVTANGYAAMQKRNQNFYNATNRFQGRVTDANNNPLPFANITNPTDNVGTYSDAKGNFTLISTDTVLNVQVRSLGFENNTANLRNNVISNQVVLQEDRRSLSEVVVSNKKVNSSRNRDSNTKFEEPEPADGWDYYDTYIANNLNVPEGIETKTSGAGSEVEVSFEVNKLGEPVNIKVEKSLCDKCDKEAIRLIKEGPKWKRKAKKGKRTTVTVPFN
jgi:hypothetical protein